MAQINAVNTKLLRRSSLPTAISWNGKAATLETFIAGVEGHVDQQQHMSYLLLPHTRHLWLSCGDPTAVLTKGRDQNIHHSFFSSAHIESLKILKNIPGTIRFNHIFPCINGLSNLHTCLLKGPLSFRTGGSAFTKIHPVNFHFISPGYVPIESLS